jgi:hypothetical protein
VAISSGNFDIQTTTIFHSHAAVSEIFTCDTGKMYMLIFYLVQHIAIKYILCSLLKLVDCQTLQE